MAAFEHVVVLQPMRGEGHDRAAVFAREGGGLLIALADGAGGTSKGAIAAQAVIDAARELARNDGNCAALLEGLDADTPRLDGGQSTAILLVLQDGELRGASAGDSEAWLVDPDQRTRPLTATQVRKPLLGSGAQITCFADSALGDATLLVASDGLFRFAKAPEIARIVIGDDLAAAAAQLVALVRTPTGTWLDDIAIVLVRRRHQRSSDGIR